VHTAQPGILSIPLGFIGAIGTLLSSEPTAQEEFNELLVRWNTGLGAQKRRHTRSQFSVLSFQFSAVVLIGFGKVTALPMPPRNVFR